MDFLSKANIAEIVGSFLFVTGIFAADGDFMQICAAFAVATIVSGAGLNPAVSIVKHVDSGSNDHVGLLVCVGCQVLGGVLAWKTHEWLQGGKAKGGSGSANFNVKEFAAEAIGSFIFISGADAGSSVWASAVAMFVAMHAVGDISSELNPGVTILRVIQANGDGHQGAGARVAAQVVGCYLAGYARQYYA